MILDILRQRSARIFEVSYSVGDQLMLSGYSFITTVLLAKFLELDEFAVFGLVFSFQAILLILFNSAIGQYILLEADRFDNRSCLILTGVTFSVSAAGTYLLVSDPFHLFSVFNGQHGTYEKLVMSANTGLFMLLECFRRFYFNKKLFRVSFFSSLIYVVPMIAVLLLFRDDLTLRTFYAYNSVFLFMALIGKWKLIVSRDGRPFDMTVLYNFSKWLCLGMFFYIVASKLFVFFLGVNGTASDVATFRIIESVFNIAMVLIASLENYLIVKVKSLELTSLKPIFNYVIKYMSVVFLMLALVYVCQRPLMRLLFHERYEVDNWVFLVATLAYCTYTLGKVYAIYFRVISNTRPIFISNVVCFAIVVSYLMIVRSYSIGHIYLVILANNLMVYILYVVLSRQRASLKS